LLEGVQGVNGATVLAYPSGEFNIVVSEYARDDAQFGRRTSWSTRASSARVPQWNSVAVPLWDDFDTDEALRQQSELIAGLLVKALPDCVAKLRCT